MKKKSVIRLLSLSLCGILTAASITSFVRADANNAQSNDGLGSTEILQVLDADAAPLFGKEESNSPSKDETVYVLTGANGSVQKIIVSDWLKNACGEASLKDATSLENVENVKGEETFSTNKDGTVWDAKGNDVYYVGNSSKALPVSVSVSYVLDGREITPDELKGKSGHVTIRYSYQNNQYEMKEINGKQEKIYVPFATLTGVLLDNEVFTNIEVKGGRLINDGDRTIVAGIVFPGLKENLKADETKFEIPDTLEIHADVKNFEIGTSISIATNEIFNQVNLDGIDSMDALRGAMEQLTDAMDQLLDGSSQLTDGLALLLEKSADLSSGVDRLASGSAELKKGASDLNNGAGQLQGGISSLSDGLSTLASNNEALNSGARQVFDTLLSTARTQLVAAGLSVPEMTVENYSSVLNGVIASLDETTVYAQALQTVTNAVNAQADLIREKVTEAVKAEVEKGVTETVKTQVEAKVTQAVMAQVKEKVTAAVTAQITGQVTTAVCESVTAQVILEGTGMDVQTYQSAAAEGMIPEETQAAINAAIDAQMASESVQAIISSKVAEQMNSENVQAIISSKTEEQMNSDEVQALISENTDAQMKTEEVAEIIRVNTEAKMAEDSIQALIETNVQAQIQQIIAQQMAGDEVQAALSAASEGAKQVIALKASLDNYNTFYLGLQSYTAGVAQAASGSSQLNAGANSLKAGTQKLYEGADQLNNGLVTLKDSLPALIDGISRLRDGSKEMADGLSKFNDDGIQKLVSAVDGDLELLMERLKATSEVSRQYNNYSGISDDMTGQVKFIYRIAGIE